MPKPPSQPDLSPAEPGVRPKRTADAPSPSPYFLRRHDQQAVAVLTVIALAAMTLWWVRQGGLQGRVIELDRAAPLTADYLVDINRADWPELIQLPGVGETLAMRIIESRERAGPFRDHDDLRRVRGIGPKTLDALRPYLLPMPENEAVADQATEQNTPSAGS